MGKRRRLHMFTHSGDQANHGLLATAVPLPRTRLFIDELSAVCRIHFIRCIGQVTNEVLNSPTQTRTVHQVSTPFPFTALAPPSFPSRPGTSIFIDCRSEGSLVVDNSACHWTNKDKRSRCRRMSSVY